MIWPFKRKEDKLALSKFGSWADWVTMPDTSAGVKVTNETALTLSVVFACIRNISEDVAKVPLKVYQNTPDGKQEMADHPVQVLLNKRPNEEMSAMDFRQAMTAHVLGWGNAYAEIRRNIGGDVTALVPILPSRVKVKRSDSGNIVYEIQDDEGSIRTVSSFDILHIRGLGDDGLVGYNVIEYARESLGIAKASEKFGATFFGNNTLLGGILKHPTSLTVEAQNRLKQSLVKYQGPENANKILVLEEAMDFQRSVIPPKDGQFLETREFSIPEICRWFRMPPHKVADLNRATFSNIEHQALEYVTDCLTAWFKRWESAIWRQLLSEQDRRTGIYTEHVVEGLLRGDIGSRYGAYQIALGNNNNPGFMTINEIRRLENLNPVDGGDELFTPQPQQEFDNEIPADNSGDN